MLKVLSLNVNGLRSAIKRGLFDWLLQEQFDVICLQEIKLQAPEFPELPGYIGAASFAHKKGYSGVAIYSKMKPHRVVDCLGFESCDTEGRYIQCDFDDFSVVSLYCPSGTSGEHRQAVKMAFLQAFEKTLHAIQATQKPFILCGDYNIAHRAIDLKNWRANQKNTGFLPEERAWMEQLLTTFGFKDAFRVKYPEAPVYTWWSYRGQAFDKDVGWRIDYQVVTPDLQDKIEDAYVRRDLRFADHAPLVVEYRMPF